VTVHSCSPRTRARCLRRSSLPPLLPSSIAYFCELHFHPWTSPSLSCTLAGRLTRFLKRGPCGTVACYADASLLAGQATRMDAAFSPQNTNSPPFLYLGPSFCWRGRAHFMPQLPAAPQPTNSNTFHCAPSFPVAHGHSASVTFSWPRVGSGHTASWSLALFCRTRVRPELPSLHTTHHTHLAGTKDMRHDAGRNLERTGRASMDVKRTLCVRRDCANCWWRVASGGHLTAGLTETSLPAVALKARKRASVSIRAPSATHHDVWRALKTPACCAGLLAGKGAEERCQRQNLC